MSNWLSFNDTCFICIYNVFTICRETETENREVIKLLDVLWWLINKFWRQFPKGISKDFSNTNSITGISVYLVFQSNYFEEVYLNECLVCLGEKSLIRVTNCVADVLFFLNVIFKGLISISSPSYMYLPASLQHPANPMHHQLLHFYFGNVSLMLVHPSIVIFNVSSWNFLPLFIFLYPSPLPLLEFPF